MARAVRAGSSGSREPLLVNDDFCPFPPVRGAAPASPPRPGRLGLLDFTRTFWCPARRPPTRGTSSSTGEGGGSAAHGEGGSTATSTPSAPPSGFLGWFLTCIGQQHGFPVPEGGAGELTRLARRGELEATVAGENTRRSSPVDPGGRAPPPRVGVELADGYGGRRASVLFVADVERAGALPRPLGRSAPPATRFVRFARPVPVGSRHVQDRLGDRGVRSRGACAARDPGGHRAPLRQHGAGHRVHRRPHVRAASRRTPSSCSRADEQGGPDPVTGGFRDGVGLQATFPLEPHGDAGGGPRRASGTPTSAEAFADRMEGGDRGPGARLAGSRITGRHVSTTLEALDANLAGGALGGGTMAFAQQLVFRAGSRARARRDPDPGPVPRLPASAHPGGGVHGTCGATTTVPPSGADPDPAPDPPQRPSVPEGFVLRCAAASSRRARRAPRPAW